MEKHKEPWLSESALEDYQALFMSIYGINIDWKEGTFSLLEALSDNQGEKPVTVKFDYDSEIETATINLVDTQYVFHHYPMGSDGFDTELVRIEHILANSGYTLRVYQNSTFSDTLSFLLIPSDEWKRVEQHYSPEHISAYFVPYGKQLVIPEVAAPVVNYVPRLIDVSRNMLVALWFACTSRPESTGLLFGISAAVVLGLEGSYGYDNGNYNEKFPHSEAEGEQHGDLPIVWQPPVVTKRIAAQSAQFVYSDVSHGRMGSLVLDSAVCHNGVLALAITSDMKKKFLKVLERSFDIRSITLFPDFDGFCRANSEGFSLLSNNRW
ncbi:hypothetical protein ACP3WT_23935 [Salmonella enterica]|uniref:hypothetical protein n=1 Tax=Salmonella enterica TaxID=28901 RepID=UPI003CF0B16F